MRGRRSNLPGEACAAVSNLELGDPQGGLIGAQESAEGVVGHAVGEAIEALQRRKAEQRIGRAETMTEGPNDWERQVGLATHGWQAAENQQSADPAGDGSE